MNQTADNWAMVGLSFAGFALAAALFMEHVMGLPPCPLCLMQRLWVIAAGLLFALSLAHNPRLGIYPLLTAIACLVGGGFAIRQLYLQNLPPDQVPSCGPDLGYMFENFPLGDVLAAMTSGTGDCAEPDFVLGIRIAVWSLMGFALLCVLALGQLRAASK